MDQVYLASEFDEQMKRIQFVIRARTHIEFAEFFGVRQASISDAKRRGKIPAGWVLTIMRSLNVNPEWILTGRGRRYLDDKVAACNDMEPAHDVFDAVEMARKLPSRILAEELVRRITVAETDRVSHT